MRPTLSVAAKLAVAACLVAAAPHRRQFTTPDVTVIPEIAPAVVFKDYELVIDNSAVGPDGFWRSSTVAGLPGQPGTFPGPAITANRGENLRIKVRNQLVDPTMRRSTAILTPPCPFVMGYSYEIALAWAVPGTVLLAVNTVVAFADHIRLELDMIQNETANQDGASFVTQCPIGPDPGANEYTYEIPLHEQTGTFWYHGHLSSQYVDGLRGPLVIYDQADREVYDYDVDDEGTIIQLGDWYHKPTSILLSEFFSVSLPVARLHLKELIFLDSPFSQPDNGGGHEPVADAGTINGRGRCSARAPNPAECPQDVPWARINVQQGKKYRMRLINNSAFGHFHVRFEDHPMTVIEADGILHQPLVRDEVEIYAAQRYSVIIDANQPVGNYWIYAPMEMKGASRNRNLDKDRILAVLHYEGAPDVDPSTVPILPTVDARTADILEDAEIEFDAVQDALERSGASKECIQNHLAFVKAFKKVEDEKEACEPDDDPQYSPLPQPSFDTLDPATLAIGLAAEANITAVLETMCAEDADPAYIATQRAILAGIQSIRDANYINAPQRDVSAVGGGGAIFRFMATNPDWHLDAGLGGK
ncbi:hypothetical protein QFC24_005846 [Naganishia onofrii]|uniref:Uncharacterized protein n=1 Tax=Naganishia onofrii TaxID=1851511 RepID=A0ACC2X6Z4_9TREE|nr:hypothetical protein QFC24_005846 [Naganishia onofrii]